MTRTLEPPTVDAVREATATAARLAAAAARPPDDVVSPWDAELAAREADGRRERRALRGATIAAVFVHAALFLVTFPSWTREPEFTAVGKTVFVVQPVRFRPPPPKAAEPAPPRTKDVKRIPIPDPTPDEPEPILREEELVVEPALAELDVSFLGIPDAPAPPGPPSVDGQAPLEVGGAVRAPVRVHSPSPPYTEEARIARVQGVVLLRTVVDARGDVRDVEIVKGLPQGLSESAVDTVRQWKFRPATKDGKPVPVYFFLTISFHVQ